MRVSRFRGAVVVGASILAALALPSRSGPLDGHVFTAGFRYLPDETTLIAGEALEYTNLDVAPHNLIALRNGPDGQPVFRTETISAGTTVPVEGIEELEPGVYDYTCTLHPEMLGTIYVEPGVDG